MVHLAGGRGGEEVAGRVALPRGHKHVKAGGVLYTPWSEAGGGGFYGELAHPL